METEIAIYGSSQMSYGPDTEVYMLRNEMGEDWTRTYGPGACASAVLRHASVAG